MKHLTLKEVAQAVGGTLNNPSFANRQISGFSVDSREELDGKLFIPLRGQRVDGHSFLTMAFEKNAVCCLSEHPHGTLPVILVDSTEAALMGLAAYYKGLFNVKTVGITGSVGKTITKDIVASVLSQRFRVLKTQGNFNNQIGLPLTVFKLDETHEYAVLEMGMNHRGEIDQLSRAGKPDYAIITNIGVAHIENLGSQEGIFEAKCEIFNGLHPNGIAVLNGDDPFLTTVKLRQNILYYGIRAEHNMVFADRIQPQGLNAVTCRIHIKMHPKSVFDVTIPAPGKHMVSNVLAATAIGHLAGMSWQEIKRGIENLQLTKMRMDISHESNFTIINDAYNASPTSMKAALDVLAESPGPGRKVAILGDMFELGHASAAFHEDVGLYAAQSRNNVLVFVGELSHVAYLAARDHIRDNKQHFAHRIVYYFKTQEELAQQFDTIFLKDDTILLKASRGMEFEKTAQQLKDYDTRK